MLKFMQFFKGLFKKPFGAVQVALIYLVSGFIWMLGYFFIHSTFIDHLTHRFNYLLISRALYIILSSGFLYYLLLRVPILPNIQNRQLTPKIIVWTHVIFCTLWSAGILIFARAALDDYEIQLQIIYISGLILIISVSSFLYLTLNPIRDWQAKNPGTHTKLTIKSSAYKLMLVFFCLTLTIPITSYIVIEILTPQLENNAFSDLKIVSSIRASQFDGWLEEREHSTSIALTNTIFSHEVQNLLENKDRRAYDSIKGRLESLMFAQQYETLILFDANQKPVITVGTSPEDIKPVLARIQQVKKQNYESQNKKDKDFLSIVIPLFSIHSRHQLGTIYAKLDNEKYLSAYLDHWTTFFADRRIMLAEKNGSHISIYHVIQDENNNPVIHKLTSTNYGLGHALSKSDFIPGHVKGKTYSGEIALSAWHPVKGTNWFAIATINQKILIAPLRTLAFWFNFAVIFIILISGIVLLFIWNMLQRSQNMAMDLREKQLLNNFYTLPFIGMGILSVEMDKWIHFNDKMCEIFGYTRKEFEEKSWHDLSGLPSSYERIGIAKLKSGDTEEFFEEKKLHRKNGEDAVAELHFRCVSQQDGTPDYLVVTAEDITERKQAQEEIYRISQLYAALSHCNQAIIHSRTPKELFEKICYGVVHYSNNRFNMAWVGLINETVSKVDMIVSHGIPPELLESFKTMRVVSGFDNLKENSPAAIAIHENHPVWIQDTFKDPTLIPWIELLKKMAIRSLVAFPLYQCGKAIGLLKVYSSEPNAYTDQSQNLLIEMADDINFALDNFERETIRKRTQKELEESENNFRRLYTERMQAEDEIERLNQLYAAHSQCNQSIIRCKNEDELFSQLCSDIVEYGQMKLAWVGMVDRQTQDIVAIASSGDNKNYVKYLYINILPDHPAGQGPAGEVVRENKPIWMQDFINEPSIALWKEHIVHYGWRSAAILPLHKNGSIYSIIFLYSDIKNAFSESSQRLLLELMEDIDFALDNFEREKQLQLAGQVFAQSSEAIMLLDANCHIVMINEAFTHITGYKKEEILGKNPRILASGQHDKNFYATMWDTIEKESHWQGEVWNKRKNGSIYPEWLFIQTMHDAAGKLTHYIGTFTDLTERKETEERVQWLAHFDPLTSLPNRTLLHIRSNLAVSLAQRRHEPLALMFLDLDNFKNVNDSLGHSTGDELLKQFAERLQKIVREQDTISRLGGDEFVLVLPGTDTDGVAYLAERLLHSAAQQFNINRHEINLTVSIGIAMYPTDGNDFNTLWRSADAAMYRAKQNGRNNYCFFTSEMQARSARTLQIDNALRRALERNQFYLVYQPQMALDNNKIVGFEALLRWKHPQFGLIPPDEFIPIAETNGQIIPIGEWVLKTAVEQFRIWQDQGYKNLMISVNLSAVQFRHPRLVELVINILDEAHIEPKYLQLELTEGVAMENPLAAIEVIDELHKRGIRISIDDFGTGYSSLTYLKRFNVYSLKIDRSFVQDLPADQEDMAIVTAVISLANNLGMKTVAEGVETQDQLEFLRRKGCTEIQGYHLARPLPFDQVESFLINHELTFNS